MPTAASSLKEWMILRKAAYYKVLSDPMRLKIVLRLREGECCVGELAEAFSTCPSNICGHLSQLVWLELVAKQPRGNAVYYSLADPSVCTLIERAELFCRRPAPEKDTSGGAAD
jgi:DNA-binding transcriptional ArsR family regulator